MERNLSVVVAGFLIGTVISCAGGSSTSTRPPSVTVQEIKTALAETRKVCPPTTDSEGQRVVRCPVEQFRKFGVACIACGRELETEQAENRALRSTGALDLQAEQARSAELQRKLDSPWRSWWLWALIGGAITAATVETIRAVYGAVK